MGCTPTKIQYSVPLNKSKESQAETCIYRNPQSKLFLTSNFSNHPDFKTFQHIILHSFQVYANKPCIGVRMKLPDGKLGPYKFKTYDQVFYICQMLGSGILNLNLTSWVHDESKNIRFRFIGIISKNTEQYLELDLASHLYKINLISIYDTLGPEAMNFIVEQTQLETVFCSNNFIDYLCAKIKEGKCGKLKNIVAFDKPHEQQFKTAKEIGIFLTDWDHVIEVGMEKIQEFVSIDQNDIFTFCYTSGSSGLPKAVMLTHQNIIAVIAAIMEKHDISFNSDDVHLSYLSMAHMFEKLLFSILIFNGARIGLYHGDVKLLKHDLQELKPTIFATVPRLYKRFYDLIQTKFKKLTGINKWFLDRAIANKLSNLKHYAKYNHLMYDIIVFKKISDIFGGRVRFGIIGGAPISSHIIEFWKITLSCPILEAYGQTESTGLSFCTMATDKDSGHVGGPLTCIEFKLVDDPEMQYSSSDKNEKGEKTPRGEVLIRGPSVFVGYYKDPKNSEESLDKDGWLHTGDIGEIRSNGSIKIIDRKSNIFKLSHGEYIAAVKLENIYLKSRYVDDVFIYGDSLQSHLIGVVVPNKENLRILTDENGLKGTFEEICQQSKIVSKVVEDMNKVGKEEGLLAFELVKKIKLEPILFSENNLTTPSYKLRRNEIKNFYLKDLKKMYNAIMEEEKKGK